MAALEAIGALGGMSGMTAAMGPQGVAGVSGPGSVGLPGAVERSGGGFAATLLSQLESVQGLQAKSAGLQVQAATGDLTDIHDYTIASTQAKIATEVTVAVRNKGLEAFNDIMRMQV